MPVDSLNRVVARYIWARLPVLYTGVFVVPMDQQRLIRRFGQAHPVLHAHHMTLWHADDGGNLMINPILLGKIVDLKIIGYAEDERAQAVVVRPPTQLKPNGRIPHVTISTVPGVSAVYSNTLLSHQWDDEEARQGFPVIRGRVGWSDGTTVHFGIPEIQAA